MAAVTMQPSDLKPFANIETDKAALMIEDALAIAARVAPCILQEDFAFEAAAKAIIRGALLRWNEAGTGATVQQSAGPFAATVQQLPRKGMFIPAEIEQLQELCKSATDLSGAYSLDTVPAVSTSTIMNDNFYCWPYGGIC